MKDDN